MKTRKLKTVIILSTIGLFHLGAILLYLNPTTKALSAPVFYVANAGDGSISKINLQDKQQVQSISLGEEQLSHGIAVSLDEKTLYYGTGFQEKSLQALDLDTNEIIN